TNGQVIPLQGRTPTAVAVAAFGDGGQLPDALVGIDAETSLAQGGAGGAVLVELGEQGLHAQRAELLEQIFDEVAQRGGGDGGVGGEEAEHGQRGAGNQLSLAEELAAAVLPDHGVDPGEGREGRQPGAAEQSRWPACEHSSVIE